MDGLEVGAVEDDDVNGDQGREDDIELLDKLRRYGAARGGTGGASPCGWYNPAIDVFLDIICLIVILRSSVGSTLVELFHLCLEGVGLPFKVRSPSCLPELGNGSGVRL